MAEHAVKAFEVTVAYRKGGHHEERQKTFVTVGERLVDALGDLAVAFEENNPTHELHRVTKARELEGEVVLPANIRLPIVPVA